MLIKMILFSYLHFSSSSLQFAEAPQHPWCSTPGAAPTLKTTALDDLHTHIPWR